MKWYKILIDMDMFPLLSTVNQFQYGFSNDYYNRPISNGVVHFLYRPHDTIHPPFWGLAGITGLLGTMAVAGINGGQQELTEANGG